ncbi:hypothetical protein GTZ99_00820 [Novosphingobium sp. FSY-8]|uniref:Uncharacterized protein n=1 Tax=Novosphingobium ovatum TaxID=1908523 RepID=A0ABW9X984_9SPHN|nr:hypothetical protein [Novosphingobium ovatum]NBC35096.1 hypothetical protein [Novosphingobium ovatum]
MLYHPSPSVTHASTRLFRLWPALTKSAGGGGLLFDALGFGAALLLDALLLAGAARATSATAA